MTRSFNIPLLIEIVLLIPTGLSIIVKMTGLSHMTSWYLMVLFGTNALCIMYFKGIKTEIVKALCSIFISLILIVNLTSDQNVLDAFALLTQVLFSGLIIKNLIVNYSSYKSEI